MKGVKNRVMSVALCSAMAMTTIGSDVSMIANAEGLVSEAGEVSEEVAEEKTEPKSEEESETPEDSNAS